MQQLKAEQRRARSYWILNDSVHRVLATLTRPMMAGIFALMALDFIDAYLVSHLGTAQLAALGFTIPVTNALFGLAIGLSVGVVSVLTRALGSGDHHRAQRVTTDGLLIAAMATLTVAAIGLSGIDRLFGAMGANYALIGQSYHMGPKPDIMPLIREYMTLRYLGAVFWVMPLIATAAVRGTGDTRLAGGAILLWAALTALLDGVLVLGLGPVEPRGLIGVAQGHLIADLCATGGVLWILAWREHLLEMRMPDWREWLANCRQILRIGLPATGINLLTPLTIGFVTTWVASFGPEAIAAYAVGNRIEPLLMIVPLALSTSLPAFVGHNFGGGQHHRTHQAVVACLRLTLVVQLMVYVLLALFAQQIAQIFSDDPALIRIIKALLWILPLSYGGQGIVVLAVSTLNAMHQPARATALSALRLLLLYLPLTWLGGHLGGIYGVFIGAAVANLLIGAAAYWWISSLCEQARRQSPGTADSPVN